MRKILVTLLFLLFGTSAFADCNIKSGSINILANDFPALRTFVETSKQCKGSADSVSYTHLTLPTNREV